MNVGWTEIAELLVEKGVNLDVQDQVCDLFSLLVIHFIKQIILTCLHYGQTALVIADNLVTAKMLIEKGASVHVKDDVC